MFDSSKALHWVLAPLVFHGLLACNGKNPEDSQGGDDSTDTTDSGVAPHFDDASVALALDPLPTLLLPYDVEVDPVHRRAWVSSLFQDVVAEVDIDASSLIGVYELPEDEYSFPYLAVDGDGEAWVPNATGLVKIAMGGEVTSYPFDVVPRKVYGGAGSSVYVSTDDNPRQFGATLSLMDGDGAMVTSAELDQDILHIGAGPDGTIAASTMGRDGVPGVSIFTADTLEPVGTCVSPFPANGIFPTSTGDFFVLTDGEIGYARCDGSDPTSIMMGEENKFAVVEEDAITVFDRLGDRSTGGRSLGMGRRLDLDLNVISTFPTGKHSGFGGLDTVTNTAWLNSEGTAEAQAYAVDTGENTAKVRLGTHVECFATSDVPALAWVTGRLSGLIDRVDLASGTVLSATEGPMWPVSPLWHDGILYVLDQVGGAIYLYDPDTMGLEDVWALDVPENDDLDFDDLVWSDDRGTLLLALGESNLLVEVDPALGEVLGVVELGGDAPAEGTTVGRLEIATQGDEVWVVRSSDSQMTHLNLSTSALDTAVIATSDQVAEAQFELVPKLLYLSDDRGTVYFGRWAFDPDTLLPLPEKDLTGDRVLAQGDDGGYITWASATGELDYGSPGAAATPLGTVVVQSGDPYARWLGDWGGGVMFVDSEAVTLSIQNVELP